VTRLSAEIALFGDFEQFVTGAGIECHKAEVFRMRRSTFCPRRRAAADAGAASFWRASSTEMRDSASDAHPFGPLLSGLFLFLQS
jgi:hypothetical protein